MTYDGGLPIGVPVVAADLAGRAARAAARLTGRPYRVDADAVLAHVLLPLVVGDDQVPAVARPSPVAAGSTSTCSTRTPRCSPSSQPTRPTPRTSRPGPRSAGCR